MFSIPVTESDMKNLYNELQSYGFDFEDYEDFKNTFKNDFILYTSIKEYYDSIHEEDDPVDRFIECFAKEMSEESLKYIKNIYSFILLYQIQYDDVFIPRSVNGIIIQIITSRKITDYKNYTPNYEGINQFL